MIAVSLSNVENRVAVNRLNMIRSDLNFAFPQVFYQNFILKTQHI